MFYEEVTPYAPILMLPFDDCSADAQVDYYYMTIDAHGWSPPQYIGNIDNQKYFGVYGMRFRLSYGVLYAQGNIFFPRRSSRLSYYQFKDQQFTAAVQLPAGAPSEICLNGIYDEEDPYLQEHLKKYFPDKSDKQSRCRFYATGQKAYMTSYGYLRHFNGERWSEWGPRLPKDFDNTLYTITLVRYGDSPVILHYDKEHTTIEEWRVVDNTFKHMRDIPLKVHRHFVKILFLSLP